VKNSHFRKITVVAMCAFLLCTLSGTPTPVINVQAQTSNSPIPIYIQGQKKSFDSPPILRDGRVFLPIRYISEYFGAQVTWEDQTKTVTVKQGSKTISLQIGNSIAQIDGKGVSLDVPAFINGARTYVPLRFIGEALGRYVDWDQTERAVYIDTDAVSSTMQMSFGGKTFNVKVVKVFLNNPHVGLKIAYGQNQIGLTESLLSMAQRSNAIAAINGTFFRAYETTNPKEPSGNLIIDGRIEHLCFRDKPATTFGFTKDGRADIGLIGMKIEGQYVELAPDMEPWIMDMGWYVGTINRSPQYWSTVGSINLYTPKRGSTTRAYNGGTNIIVRNNTVTQVIHGDNVSIPRDGYVINIYGSEKRYEDRFHVGTVLRYIDNYYVYNGNPDIWQQGVIDGALSAGPRLITNGKITVNPEAENYTILKITEYSMARSALGLTKDNKLLMVTVNSAKIEDLATIMQKLGAYNAMNIDGGASSGLYYKGKLLTTPGRDLSNALLVIRK